MCILELSIPNFERGVSMRVAVVGSRGACGIDIGKFLPDDCHEIVSGGAKGVDRLAASYAVARGIKLTEFLPQYEKYG